MKTFVWRVNGGIVRDGWTDVRLLIVAKKICRRGLDACAKFFGPQWRAWSQVKPASDFTVTVQPTNIKLHKLHKLGFLKEAGVCMLMYATMLSFIMFRCNLCFYFVPFFLTTSHWTKTQAWIKLSRAMWNRWLYQNHMIQKTRSNEERTKRHNWWGFRYSR